MMKQGLALVLALCLLLPGIALAEAEGDAQQARRVVYLTFDDGPKQDTPELLALLDELDVPATFFLVGMSVRAFPENARLILEAGHVIGCHGMNHAPSMFKESTGSTRRELTRFTNTMRELVDPDFSTDLFRFPGGSIVTGNFLVDFAMTLWIITYAADLVALMVSCIVRTTTSAMTVMPFLLIVQLVFAGIIFPFDGGAAGLVEKLTISHWGTVAICSIADYNALPSHALFASIYQFRSIPEVQKIVDYIQSSDLRMKMDILCAKQMQNPLYAGTVENILKSWGVILLIGLVAIVVGIISLEFIDRDKR